jgi:exopolysaccharide production protein ExoQ
VLQARVPRRSVDHGRNEGTTMRIAKAYLINPDHNFAYGVVAVAISLFVFAYSLRFGQVSILAYYAVWLPLVLVDYRHALGDYSRHMWIIAFGAFACLSVFWSAAPGLSARASVQYATHIVCALIAARTVSMRTLALGAVAGISIIILYSLAFGSYEYDPIDGSYSFAGAFASKNQLGFFSSIGIFFSFAALFILRERGIWRLLAFPCLALCGYALLASQSATAIIATAATLSVMMALGLVQLFSPNARRGLFLVGILAGLVVASIVLSAGGLDVLLGAFGKDSTLTGRTYIWSQGLQAASMTPLLGTGYQAYWVQGFPEAERLWAEFYISARSGFHFHNTYIEVLVELGGVGLVLLSLIILRVTAGHLRQFLVRRNDATAFLAFGLAVMLLIRSPFEVDIINPYQVGSFLLYYSAGLVAARGLALRSPYAAVRPGPRPREA